MNLSFLEAQLDYVLFAHGLLFISVTGISFAISRYKNSLFPWKTLALFGALQGLYEWMDLAPPATRENTSFPFIHNIVLLAAFMFLFEFARRAYIEAGKKAPGFWIVFPFLGLGFSGLRFGISSLNASLSYFLGFVGATWAAVSIYLYGKKLNSGRAGFLIASLGMFTYGILSYLIPSKAEFFPASIVNHQDFLSKFHFPIETLEFPTMCLVVAGLWYIGQVQIRTQKNSFFSVQNRWHGVWLAPLLIAVVCGGWFLTEERGEHAKEHLCTHQLGDLNWFSNVLSRDFDRARSALLNLTSSKTLINSAYSRFESNSTNEILDNYCQLSNFSVCYIMDTKGIARASSNRKTSDSFVGNDYSARPYFKDAMAGNIGQMFALGKVSNKYGFFISAPILNNGKPVGVAAVKLDVDRYASLIGNFQSGLLSSERSVFFSGKELSLKGVGSVACSNIKIGSRSMQIVTLPYLIEGWRLFNIEGVDDIFFARHIAILFLIAVCLILILGYIAIEQLRDNSRLLAVNEHRYRKQFTDQLLPAVLVDPEKDIIVDANPAACNFYGYAYERFVGMPLEKIATSTASSRHFINTEIIKKGQIKIETQHKLSNGEIKEIQFYACPIEFNGKNLIHFIAIDNSERKKAEAAERQMLRSEKFITLGILSSGVAHEINNPLQIIKGNASFLKKSLTNNICGNEQLTCIDKQIQAADRIAKIVNELREYAHQESDEMGPVDLSLVVEKSLSMIRHMNYKHSVEIEINSKCKDPIVYGNTAKLIKVVINLISNAFAATTGRDKAHILIETIDNPTNIILKIEDNGVGIDETELSHIFDPFFTTKDPGDGLGLGLSLVQSHLTAMNGTIHVQSKKEIGTTFEVCLVRPQEHETHI